MKLKSITLENFRSFKDPVPIEGLSNVNVFIGANNTGKSNIIEALRYVQYLSQNRQLKEYKEMVFDGETDNNIHLIFSFSLSSKERTAFIKKMFVENPNFRVHEILESPFLSNLILDLVLGRKGLLKEEIKVTNIISGDLTIIRSTINQTSQHWSFERLELMEQTKNTKFENIKQYPMVKTERTPPSGWQILLKQGMTPSPLEYELISKIKEHMENWYWLQPVRQATPKLRLGEQSQLDSAGNNLVQVIFTLQNNDPEKKARIQNEFLTMIPEMSKVDARLKGGEAIVTIDENSLKSIRDLSNVSSGLVQSLILTSGILNGEKVSLFLIEEPEIHLHASSQRKLFETIKRESENKQFFLTSHSTIFSTCDEKGSTYLVTKRNGASAVRRIQEPEELKVVKECLGHRNSDLFSDECVVFIEGDSEEKAFPIIAKALGIDFRAKGIRLINVEGRDKVPKLHEYLKYLKDTDVIIYVIVDGNQRLKDCLKDWEREGLISSDNWAMWDLEFEDCFNLEFIANIVNDMYKEKGVELKLTAEQLTQKDEKSSVVKTLKKILFKQDLDLDKPELAERIAISVAENVGKEGHEDTSPEIEIKKIVKLVDKDFPFPDVQKDVKREKAYSVPEIRKKYAKAYKKWTNSDDLALLEKHREGMTIDQLAEHFQRKPNAIRSRIVKLQFTETGQ